ncbi:hypothetical protein [Dactylosporangium sp. NPDC051484]|uniref:hypothetical protein n=1 Tax=Dactylosporangium sp. NPDC051484 TaxID=3154942 RepID=UPI00344E71D0
MAAGALTAAALATGPGVATGVRAVLGARRAGAGGRLRPIVRTGRRRLEPVAGGFDGLAFHEADEWADETRRLVVVRRVDGGHAHVTRNAV